ncbi:hypothetical protein PU683_06660 [Kosakonia cowanii]|uniref:hypothetical protein n=1 Tax=Kosakonia cowanii TaxID=208223 RepID=UPI0023F6D734|nr:hypothetical protein [Kosakonia cowanii]MDF7759211.1 hypothetical protein [Kosakonia cowanii]
MTDLFPHSVVLNDEKYAANWDMNKGVIRIVVGENPPPLHPGDVVELFISGKASNIKKFTVTSPPIHHKGASAEKGRKCRLLFNVSELRG